ncbi:MAG: AI-2E family transporter [Actinomycetota bacterium]|nr:AI-2E family transporter [Actinomycetota bacterium]
MEDAPGGHHKGVGQPHTEDEEGPIAEAEEIAAEIRTPERPLGEPGKPLNRRSPFLIGLTGAAGVAVTIGLVQMLVAARDVLVLIGVSFFLAVGLEPAVSFLARHRLPRWAAVTVVMLGLVGVVVGFSAAAIPPLAQQASGFVEQVPQFVQSAQDSNSWLGQLNERFQLRQRIETALSGGGLNIVGGILGAGAIVLGMLVSTLLVLVLTIYFLADLPRIRRALYRVVPHSRRPRVILIGDEIFAKVGGFVLGNIVISFIAGTAAFIWLVIFGVPYSLLLAILVALLNVVPAIGPATAGLVCSLVALTVSLPVALATAGYFIVYRLVEDYVLLPKVMGRAVQVPALVTILAVTLGVVLLGVIGAIVAIPIAAAVLLIFNEVLVPRLDST